MTEMTYNSHCLPSSKLARQRWYSDCDGCLWAVTALCVMFKWSALGWNYPKGEITHKPHNT